MVKHALIVIAVAVCAAQPAETQQPGEISYNDVSEMPTGIVGERIASLIATLNSADPDRVRHFIEVEVTPEFRAIAPMETHVQVFLETALMWGTARFHGIRSYTPARSETVVILKDSNFDTWRAFTLVFDEAQGHRISNLAFNDARTPTNVVESRITEGELVEEVNMLIRRICRADLFSGSVLVANADGILLERACGEASKRFHAANNTDTKFNLGSMNKMFTSVAIAQLVERGVLSYDDAISKYVDESWLPREITDRITIHHLLTHTSGLGSYFNDTFWQGSRELYRTVDDFKALVNGDTPAFTPGSDYRYSNTGMLLLGVVIESVTGHSYFDHIRANIYEPAGMTNSDSYEMDYPVENLAIGYVRDPGSEYGWENNLYKHVIKGGPAGGGFSTVGDLYRFAHAMQNNTLVSEETRQRMWTDHSGTGYGYGFSVATHPAGLVVGHGGGFPGLNGNLDLFVDSGYVVAVLANYDGGAGPVARRINGLLARLNLGT